MKAEPLASKLKGIVEVDETYVGGTVEAIKGVEGKRLVYHQAAKGS